jgi:hypothetical protein
VSGRALVALAAAAAVLLVGTYVAAGGLDYTVASPGDPCKSRAWRKDAPFQDELVRSAFDGAACRLGLPRAQVALALSSDSERKRLIRDHQLSDGAIADAVQAGARRAIDDAQRAGRIGIIEALALRAVVATVPSDQLLSALRRLAGG